MRNLRVVRLSFRDFLRGLEKSQSSALPRDPTTSDKALISLRLQKQKVDERAEKARLKEFLRQNSLREERKVFSKPSFSSEANILKKDKKSSEKRFMTAKNNIFS